MQGPSRGNTPLAILLVLLGVAFAVLCIFYIAVTTSFLASSEARHYKHAIAAAALAIACLIGANFARQARA
jgi:hypothetical protein